MAPNAAPSAPVTSALTDVDLAAEHALIDRARSAVARGDATAALEAINTHVVRFAHGRLVEEREALAVQALTRAGRRADAKSRADAFRKSYPESIFGPAVDLAAP